jgi:hypothetical protein
VIFFDKQTGMSYAFTTKGHSAHPSWITRQPQENRGNISIAQIGYFAGSESEFAKLFRAYKEMTDKAVALQKNAAFGKSTKPEIVVSKGFDRAPSQDMSLEALNFGYSFIRKYEANAPDSYELLAKKMKSFTTKQEWITRSESQREAFGGGAGRHIHRITWYPNTDKENEALAYAAFDFSGEFINTTVHCGYVVAALRIDNQYEIVRLEENTIDNLVVKKMSETQITDFKKQFCR